VCVIVPASGNPRDRGANGHRRAVLCGNRVAPKGQALGVMGRRVAAGEGGGGSGCSRGRTAGAPRVSPPAQPSPPRGLCPKSVWERYLTAISDCRRTTSCDVARHRRRRRLPQRTSWAKPSQGRDPECASQFVPFRDFSADNLAGMGRYKVGRRMQSERLFRANGAAFPCKRSHAAVGPLFSWLAVISSADRERCGVLRWSARRAGQCALLRSQERGS
jgi:hypothetical protein